MPSRDNIHLFFFFLKNTKCQWLRTGGFIEATQSMNVLLQNVAGHPSACVDDGRDTSFHESFSQFSLSLHLSATPLAISPILRIYQLSIHTVHKRLDLVRGVTGLNKDANNTLDMILSLIVAI